MAEKKEKAYRGMKKIKVDDSFEEELEKLFESEGEREMEEEKDSLIMSFENSDSEVFREKKKKNNKKKKMVEMSEEEMISDSSSNIFSSKKERKIKTLKAKKEKEMKQHE